MCEKLSKSWHDFHNVTLKTPMRETNEFAKDHKSDRGEGVTKKLESGEKTKGKVRRGQQFPKFSLLILLVNI